MNELFLEAIEKADEAINKRDYLEAKYWFGQADAYRRLMNEKISA